MSQPLVSQTCSPSTHGNPSTAGEVLHARRSPYAISSSPISAKGHQPPQQQHHVAMTRSPSQDRSSCSTADITKTLTTKQAASITSNSVRRSSTTSQSSPNKEYVTVRPLPASMTRSGPAPMGNSLSTPAVARQHILHTTPVVALGSDKRNSASLLALTADAARTSQTFKAPSSTTDETAAKRATNGVQHTSTESSSSASSNSSQNGSSTSLSDTSSRASSNPTTCFVSNESESGRSAKNTTAAQPHHIPFAESPSVVSSQPPAPPSMAVQANHRLINEGASDGGGAKQDPALQASTMLPRTTDAMPNGDVSVVGSTPTVAPAVAADAADADAQCCPPPTIEQRDALARRVYAACQAAGYAEWTQLLDMAPLASQHHLSGYNCIKFGQDGSPYAYLPFSLQQPMQANELMEKQKLSEASALTWLAQKRAKRQHDRSTEDDDVRMRDSSPTSRAVCRSCATRSTTTSTNGARKHCVCGPLQNEAVLSSEWETSITAPPSSNTGEAAKSATSPTPPQPTATPGATPTAVAVKTSDTHPISISPIIPPELLDDVSVHVFKGLSSSVSGEAREGTLNYFDSQTSDEAHHTLQVNGTRLIRCRMTKVELSEVAFRAERELIEASQEQRKPRTLVLRPPVMLEPVASVVRDALLCDDAQEEHVLNDGDDNDRRRAHCLIDRRLYCETQCQEESDADNNDWDADRCTLQNEVKDNTPAMSSKMGNLLLSSCPGKKVRLTGPVRGRGAICRDLGLDLLRVRQMGVAAIVCCLDDEELSYLGAPWHEYEREADRLGIEVIRLPMAEGFSPTDIVAADKAIGCVVNDYTLRGTHVLVHCRGGVGRAGLIACMWMLKLGLVRSDRDEVLFRLPLPSLAVSTNSAQLRRRCVGDVNVDDNSSCCADGAFVDQDVRMTDDVMQTVHRLIETIRRRRSPKAIETAEQVHFLVRYMTYLKHLERQRLHHLAHALTTTAVA